MKLLLENDDQKKVARKLGNFMSWGLTQVCAGTGFEVHIYIIGASNATVGGGLAP